MKFGKLEDIGGVDFTLPPDHPDTAALFQKLEPSKAGPQVYFACPAWNDKNFIGRIYPKGTKQADFLYHYSRSFNAIELNSTFYGIKRDNIHRWKDMVPKGFLFCPKLTRQISHYRQLNNVRMFTEEFVDAVAAFEHNLGPSFLLLPPNFTPRRFDLLENFIREFPKGVQLAVELRHHDWFNDAVVTKRLFDLFEQHGVISIITDVAGRRDVLHQRITTPEVIIRFVGNHLHPTDYTRIDSWAVRLKEWFDQGLKTAYFFLHQPEEHLNTDIALHFVEKVNTEYGWNIEGPELITAQNEQQSLF